MLNQLESLVVDTIDGHHDFHDTLVAVARYQAEYVPGLRSFWNRRGFDPDGNNWDSADIPAVSTDTFRHARLVSTEAPATTVFRTSGTTSGPRGEHWHISTRTYDHAALTHARTTLGLKSDWLLSPLVLPASETPDSSLAYMTDLFRNTLDDPQPPWALDSLGNPLPDAIHNAKSLALESGRPLLIIGTSFAIADALDHNLLANLPRNTRIVSTGGFKGRRTTIDPETLATAITTQSGVPRTHQHSEYGMTEWSSQLWSAEALDASDNPHARRLVPPPWTRVTVVDPESLLPCPDGVQGLVRMVDIANTDSVVATQTSDVARIVDGRLELVGRAANSPPRGCSLTIEELHDIAKETP